MTTQRQYPGAPVTSKTIAGQALSGATTGIKLTYTCPAGRQARVVGANSFPTAGAATIDLKTNIAGFNMILSRGTGAIPYSGSLILDAADTCFISVSTLDAAGLFDGVISVEEYLAQ